MFVQKQLTDIEHISKIKTIYTMLFMISESFILNITKIHIRNLFSKKTEKLIKTYSQYINKWFIIEHWRFNKDTLESDEISNSKELDVPAYRNIGLALRDKKTASLALKRFIDYLAFR